MEKDEFIETEDKIIDKQLVIDFQDTITALKGYNFFLLQVSKSKMRSRKERKNAEYDIKVVERLINIYEKDLEELKK